MQAVLSFESVLPRRQRDLAVGGIVGIGIPIFVRVGDDLQLGAADVDGIADPQALQVHVVGDLDRIAYAGADLFLLAVDSLDVERVVHVVELGGIHVAHNTRVLGRYFKRELSVGYLSVSDS